MATVISKNEFIEFDGQTKVSLDKLFVEIPYGPDDEIQKVALNKLFVKDGKNVRAATSYSEFIKFLKKNLVFTSINAIQPITYGLTDNVKVIVKGIHVPRVYDSHVIDKKGATIEEKVPYGLRRNLKVQQASSTDAIEDQYYFVEINGKEGFVHVGDIYFYDSANRKRKLVDYKGDFSDLGDVQFYSGSGLNIDHIYTEKKYVFPSINASEKVDFEKQEKTIYEVEIPEAEDEDVKVTYSSIKVDKYFSEQHYIRTEIEDERRPGKTKEISLIQVRNFRYDPNGKYLRVTINGYTKMVDVANLVDEESNPITSMLDMVGKKVCVLEDGRVVAKTDELTFEQAHSLYATIKTFQETTLDMSDESYLRLKDGNYIKENEIRAMSYKAAAEDATEFDAYLVKIVNSDVNEKFQVVSKAYFEKHGEAKFKRENSIKIQRCAFDDAECSVVQTTSKGQDIEQCRIVKSNSLASGEVRAQVKVEAHESFMAEYLAGAYILKDMYVDGELKELSPRRQRYVYSDISYLEDFADYKKEYQGLKTEDIQIVNGKMVGGPKYNIKKGIKKNFKTWRKWLDRGMVASIFSGFFIPGGTIVGAVYSIGIIVAAPIIPLVQTIKAAVVNAKRKRFHDKAELNRKAELADLKKRLEHLYERQTSDEYVHLPEARFEDEYSRLVNDIISLSSSNIANELHVVDGVAQVTPENAAAARIYMYEYKAMEQAIKKESKYFNKIKKKFEDVDARMKWYEDNGRVIPESLQKKYDEAKTAYDEEKAYMSELEEKREGLLNYHGNPTELQTDAERDHLLNVAEMMRTAVYMKTFRDNPLVHEALYGEQGLTDMSDIQIEADLEAENKIYTPEELEKIHKEFYPNYTQAEFQEMLKVNSESPIVEHTPEQVEEYRKQYADRAMKMLDDIEMDFTNGLMVDGMGVGLSDEVMSRMPGYSRGYEWAKVKQAIEMVNQGLRQQEEAAILAREEPIFNSEDIAGEDELVGDGDNNSAGQDSNDVVPGNDEDKKEKAKEEKVYDARIVSEDSLVKLLKAKPQSKDRKTLISFIEDTAGVVITEDDIRETIERIDSKHNPKKGKSKSATLGAKSLKNENIYNILTYGQQYLTEYAKVIKERTSKNSEHSV